MSRPFERLAPSLCAFAAAALALPLTAQRAAESDWSYYSGNAATTRYSPLSQIDASNVARLRIAWRHPHVDPAITRANPDLTYSNRYMSTPIYVDGLLYVPNGWGLAEAIDPKTGRTVWTQKPLVDGPEGLPSIMISKCVAYWAGGDGASPRIFNVRQQHLFALDPRTGAPVTSFGDGGQVNLTID